MEHGNGGEPAPHLTSTAAAASTTLPPALPSAATTILCNAVLIARAAGSSLLAVAISTFVREYLPLTPGLPMLALHAKGEWGAMGPLLLSRLLLPSEPSTPSETDRHASSLADSACVLDRNAFYPIAPADAAAHFGPWDEARDRPVWQRIQASSVAVHLWHGLTREVEVTCGSLVHRLLESSAHVRTPPSPLLCVPAQ